MMKQVLSEVFEQRIVVFEFEGDEFIASAQLSLFVSEDVTDIPDYLYDLHEVDPVTSEVGDYDPTVLDQENYLKDMFTEFAFNYALTQSDFQLTEETVNKLIYSSQEGFSDMNEVVTLDLPDGTTRDLEIGVQGIWFEFSPEGLQAKALVQLDSISSVVIIKATIIEALSSDTELVFDFTEVTFGEDADETDTDYVSITDLSVFKEMLAELGDVEFGVFDEFGVLTISAERISTMMQEGSEDGAVIVTGIALVEDAIEIAIEASDPELQAALDALSDELNTIIEGTELLEDLGTVLDTENEGPEQDVYNAIEDLQESLQNDEVPEPEEIEALFEDFQEMDSETQDAFLETFEDLFSPEVLAEWEEAFGDFSGDDLPVPE
jgi:hypothetical protein